MRMMKWMTGLLTVMGGAAVAVAQEAADAGEKIGLLERTYGMSLKEVWACGGWVMWVLAALSIFALAMVLYFIWALRAGAVIPHALVSDVLSRVRSGDLNEARRLADRTPCPFASVVLAALNCLRNVPNCDSSLLRSTMEAEGTRQADAIQGQTEMLLDVSTIAPLIGLLGTVLGMFQAFGGIADGIEAAKPVVLAAGVSKAIVTTIFALIVAIPCMACYALFRRRASRQISNLEAVSSEVVTALIALEQTK
ncbi:MAG: MotA/TolQ/ExbB proton channel family protein [Kiritimatiellaeota bacterium]|nr:MotA/TolQ/ExbB proton channel family protein [Kiritimatiellota bacterium]